MIEWLLEAQYSPVALFGLVIAVHLMVDGFPAMIRTVRAWFR